MFRRIYGTVEGKQRERGGPEGTGRQAEGQGQSFHAGSLIHSDVVGGMGCVMCVGGALSRRCGAPVLGRREPHWCWRRR